ncbi:MAG: S8 family peptidase [Hungatella sp.]|jgi:subtilisin family serine protease|nr:S8 family peptidase [Hungatella sp.]
MNKITDNNYYDFLVRNINLYLKNFPNGSEITPINEQVSLLNVKLDQSDACILGNYSYRYFPHLYTLTSSIATESSGITSVQNNPSLNLYGRGTIIGVIDTGIDYRHPAFRYSDGSSRILSIWDQTVQESLSTAQVAYGTEYSREQLNEALFSDDPLSIIPTTDSNGHGTAIASIIAGSPDPETSFSGITPAAELVIVKLKEAKQNLKDVWFVPEDVLCYQESDILFGMSYLVSVSQKLRRPLSICIALGSNQGIHDGISATSMYASFLSRIAGISVVVSAGNEGNSQRHYFNFVNQEPYYDDIELRIGEKEKRFSMEIWPFVSGSLSITITSPNNETTRQIFPSLNDCREFDFVFSGTTIWVNNITFEQGTGNQLIVIRFDNPLPGVWTLHLQSTYNEFFSFHSWLPAGNLISDETYFLNSDPDTTITSPGNGSSQLTVTAYNQFNGSLLIKSGRGYTKSGLVKPDVAAPGFELPCALPDNRYGTITGSGAAAAHTTGSVAMVMEWAIVRNNYINMTGIDITTLIQRGANRTITDNYPNNRYGYGRLSIDGVFQRIANL